MPTLGRIEAESATIDPKSWLELIDSDESLGHVPPRKGVNPFSREPCEYKAPASTAVILIGGTKVGSIYWAMDGSPFLVVEAEEGSIETVAKVAKEFATTLGARFIRE